MYKRWQEANLNELYHHNKVLHVIGPRRCGKSTMIDYITKEHGIFDKYTMDDSIIKESCQKDPLSLLQYSSNHIIIDEVQKVPNVLEILSNNIDTSPRDKHIATSSLNILNMPDISKLLTNDMDHIRLRTFTQGEIAGKLPSFLENIIFHNFKARYSSSSKDNALERALKGGFPETIKGEAGSLNSWGSDYINHLFMKDLRDICEIRNYDDMQKLVRLAASLSSKSLDKSSIQSELSIQKPTFNNYFSAVELMFIIEMLPSYTHTDYKRIVKKPKLFITDSFLMASILNWNMDTVRFDTDKSDILLKTFIFHELISMVDFYNGDYQMYHYKDNVGHNIDFIIEDKFNNTIGITVETAPEIKLSHFKDMQWFIKNVAGSKKFKGVILHTGKKSTSFAEDLLALPIASIWE